MSDARLKLDLLPPAVGKFVGGCGYDSPDLARQSARHLLGTQAREDVDFVIDRSPTGFWRWTAK